MSLLSLLGVNVAYAANAAVASGAAAGAHPQGSFLSALPMLIIFAVLFYFLLIRPQSKRAKQHKQLMSNLNIGNDVISAGGIVGTIKKLEDNFVHLQIADGVTIKMQKSSIATVLPKGSVENSEAKEEAKA